MLKTYSQAQKYLESFIPTPQTTHTTMQLERIAYLCHLLGNPQNQYPIIHVGGTSGKGSTATFCATILTELGLKTGLHTSPHLELLTERMQINNKPIPTTYFLKLLNEISDAIKKVSQDRNYGRPTYFEILVALSFYYFAKEKVAAAIIEVGLGGKLDGTNIIQPSLAILTNVSLDHTHLLGKTVGQIAKDKMQIIKAGAPAAVSGVTQPSLIKLLTMHCQDLDVPLYLVNRDFIWTKEKLALLGDFQKQNFTLATMATSLFVQKYFAGLYPGYAEATVNAKKSAFIPGRLEIVSQKPLTILDGAHNSAKIKALVNSLKNLYPKQKWITLMAVKKDKAYKTLLRQLNLLTDTYVFTLFNKTVDTGPHLGLNPNILKSATSKPALLERQSAKALKIAMDLSQKKQLPLLVTGSLYLVGEIRLYFHLKTFAFT